MKKIRAFSALKIGGKQSSYEKLKMGEAQLEERKHQIAQKLIERILKQADRPRPRKAARLSIRVHRVHIKVRHFIVTRFLGRLRARMLLLMSWIASRAKSLMAGNVSEALEGGGSCGSSFRSGHFFLDH